MHSAKKSRRKGRRNPREGSQDTSLGKDFWAISGPGRWVVGLHAAAEVFKVRPSAIRRIYLREAWATHPELREFHQRAEVLGLKVHVVSENRLHQLSSSHQGVALAVEGGPQWNPQALEGKEPCVVMVLDQITDSNNLGAILRTSWLMGARAIFVPALRANHLSPSAAKVASGGAEHIPVVVEDHLPILLKHLKSKGFWIYGLAAHGAKELWTLQLPTKVAWVVGAEDKGLRSSVENECDELVALFQVTPAASYNASVAAAMALAETQRQLKSP